MQISIIAARPGSNARTRHFPRMLQAKHRLQASSHGLGAMVKKVIFDECLMQNTNFRHHHTAWKQCPSWPFLMNASCRTQISAITTRPGTNARHVIFDEWFTQNVNFASCPLGPSKKTSARVDILYSACLRKKKRCGTWSVSSWPWPAVSQLACLVVPSVCQPWRAMSRPARLAMARRSPSMARRWPAGCSAMASDFSI